ncbi:LysR substrate-binding domain-containing protein [Mannheimia haemolytica]|nr:LysR substrate-binding domain-containing protein [Mannheimia haemolytica]STY63034.1 LysR family transcriptional regulator [Mannheimia haemolytica]
MRGSPTHRLATLGGILAWEFRDPITKKIVKFQPQGNLTANNGFLLQHYAKQGLGILWSPQDSIQTELDNGNLVPILTDWAMQYEGYHLYYPDRRQNSPLLKALIDVLRG